MSRIAKTILLGWVTLIVLGNTNYANGSKSQSTIYTKEVTEPAYSIAEIESYHRDIVKTGLATLLCPKTAVTARHIVNESDKTKIIFGDQVRTVSYCKELRDLNTKDANADTLANDIIIIGWDEPITIKNKKMIFPTLASSPPEKNESILIPRFKDARIIWEKRHISGLDSHCSWVGLPRTIYKGILWLNGEKINQGAPFNVGDSGGGWITDEGVVVAVTSRVDQTGFSPHKQTAYGANVIVNRDYIPNSGKKKNTIAYRPMLAATLLLILIWAITQMRGLYNKKT